MSKGLVSVIIPTYNRAKYIERAINSVLNQTYKNFEVIIVDDNNPISIGRITTEKIMKKYENDKQVIYIKHEKNMNGAVARNTGIAKSSGKYITFLDDDDYYLPNRLELLVDKLENNADYDVVYSGVIVVENKRIKKLVSNNLQGNLENNILSQKSFFATGSNLFFTAKSLKEISGFDVSFKRHQDLEVLVRFFEKNFKATYVPDFLVVKSEEDRQNIPNIDNMMSYRDVFLEKFSKEINKFNKNEIYCSNFYNLLVTAIRTKNLNNYRLVKKYIKGKNENFTFSLKDKIKIVIEFINIYFPIINFYRRVRFFFEKKQISSDIYEFLKINGDI